MTQPGRRDGAVVVRRDRWQEIREVFQDAVSRAPAERIGFLRARCADDSGLLVDVLALLDAHEHARDDRFLRDVIGAVARELVARTRGTPGSGRTRIGPP
jgi:hypothetical protein